MLELAIPVIILGAVLLLSWPLGRYMRWAMDPTEPGPRRQVFDRAFGRTCGRATMAGQGWKAYVFSMLAFNAVAFGGILLVLLTQDMHPLNPDRKTALEPTLAFNTAASFTTNTNLQHYSGEAALSYFSQIFGIMWLQFISAATGIAAVAAMCRALSGRTDVGNFFHDVWRATSLILLPLAAIGAILLVISGVPMTFAGAETATTLEGAIQTIARGPVAAVVAIKQLGTNGGGYFGPNSSHPFENPGFWSNLLSNSMILLVPCATVWMFGRITQRMRHATVVFGVMLVLLLGLMSFAMVTESAPTSSFAGLPVADSINLEGKELRFGPTAGSVWATSTTAASNGSVNAMHDSLNPLTGLVPMTGMWLNVVFGGVGVGLINMFVFIIVTVFIAGLMVGRTPEYLGRKVGASEMKLAAIALLVHPLFILGGVALFAVTTWGIGAPNDPGSHGLSEIIYEFSSASANNGSGFEGLSDNTPAWNIATGIVMVLGRFVPVIAPLAIAGNLSAKRVTPESAGTFRVDTGTFGIVLLAVVLIVGALLFLPLAILGPVAEHLSVTR